MSFEEHKKIMLNYIQQDISHSRDETKLENFFKFIDELEDKAKIEPVYFSLISDCYMQIGDAKKAKEAFLKIYNPKNKKDLKKLYDYDSIKCQPIIRPSKRGKTFPEFKYVSKEILTDMFLLPDKTSCVICNSKSESLYSGMAYGPNMEKITFANSDEKFCAKCIYNGSAAKKYGIFFNLPLINEFTVISKEKKDELLFKTPACSHNFDDFNEDIWPTCCNDFCKYIKRDNDVFYFKCNSCGTEIVWEKET